MKGREGTRGMGRKAVRKEESERGEESRILKHARFVRQLEHAVLQSKKGGRAHVALQLDFVFSETCNKTTFHSTPRGEAGSGPLAQRQKKQHRKTVTWRGGGALRQYIVLKGERASDENT